METFVGCDIGTSGVRATVFDESGFILGNASCELPISTPAAGQAEQDLGEMETLAHEMIGLALVRAKSPSRVSAIAISSQMSGLGAVDEAGDPAMRYDSWLDNRCEPYISQLSDRADLIRSVSGCAPTYSHAPKMLYWRNEHPQVWERISKFVSAGGFVASRLAGLGASEMYLDRTYSHFTNLADLRTGEWSSALIESVGLDESRLPRLVEPTEIIGTVRAEASRKTGLPLGTPIVAGSGDTTASALGAGVMSHGQAYDVAGTASVLGFCVSEVPSLEEDSNSSLLWSRGLIPDTFLALSFINGGGLALRWLRDVVFRDSAENSSYEMILEEASRIEPGAEGLLWFPHLQGQVLPPLPNLRAGLVGLTSRHTRGHVSRAVLEGIAFEYARWAGQVRQALSINPHEVRSVGGGSASDLWNQIKADVLGIPWVPVGRSECGVLGDAMLAAVAVGHANWSTVSQWQEPLDPVNPNPSTRRRYEGFLDSFNRVAEAMHGLYQNRTELSAAQTKEN